MSSGNSRQSSKLFLRGTIRFQCLPKESLTSFYKLVIYIAKAALQGIHTAWRFVVHYSYWSAANCQWSCIHTEHCDLLFHFFWPAGHVSSEDRTFSWHETPVFGLDWGNCVCLFHKWWVVPRTCSARLVRFKKEERDPQGFRPTSFLPVMCLEMQEQVRGTSSGQVQEQRCWERSFSQKSVTDMGAPGLTSQLVQK